MPEPVPDMLAGLGRGVRGVRIGYDPNHPSDVDAEIAAAVDAGVAVLAGLGAEIVELEMPDLDPYVLAWPILCTAEAVVAHAATYPSRKDEYGPWFRSWLFNGAPALPLPCGFSRDDLPLSLQLVGKPLAEPLLIQVGHAYEQATDWHRRHPPVDDAAPQPGAS